MEITEYLSYKMQRLNLLAYTPTVNQSHQSFLLQVEQLTNIPQTPLSQNFLETVDKKYQKDFYTSTKNGQKSFKEVLEEENFIKNEKVNKINKSNTENFIKKDEDKMQCNHNPNDEKTTLKKMKKRIMVSPEVQFFICECCNNGFKFKKDDNGKLVEK